MERRRHFGSRNGFTLTEVLVAGAIGLMVLAVLASTSLSLRRSTTATEQFARDSTTGSRLLDYVVQDLRRAVGVSSLSSGTYAVIKTNATVAVSETTHLAIEIPDYYGSNEGDGAAGSPFRTSRYPRSQLNVLSVFNGSGAEPLNGTIEWKEAVTRYGSVETARFAPADLGNGRVEVRYYRAARSPSDPSLCYFRAEYSPGAAVPNFRPEEIAERISTGGDLITLIVQAAELPPNDARHGRVFRVTSAFQPRFRHSREPGVGAEQHLTVVLRNARRD